MNDVSKKTMKTNRNLRKKARKKEEMRPLRVNPLQRFAAYATSVFMAFYPVAGMASVLPAGPDVV